MSGTLQMKARRRDVVGKANRRLSARGLVPAIVYGEEMSAQAISLDRHDTELELSHSGYAAVYKLAIDDDKPVDVVIRALQRDVRKGTLLHIDFLAVHADKLVSVSVPVHLVGDAEGVKTGGVLTHDLHEITIEAKPADLPEALEADISAMEIGSAIHVSDLAVPSGVTVLEDPARIVCSVLAPQLLVEEEVVEEAEAAEPELIGETEAEAEEG